MNSREDCFLLERDMLMWVDETGSNSRDNGPPSYDYALRGVTPTTHRKNIEQMLIALEDFDLFKGILIPNMMPFVGINPRSVVIMDYCKAGILLLPPL